MRKLSHPRSRLCRGSLAVTLLAWATLVFGTFARPINLDTTGMTMSSPKAMTMSGAMDAHCDDMAQQGHPSAPAQPMNGHDCCHGGCYCSSSCAGIAGALWSFSAWQPAPSPVIRPIHSEPGLTPAAPPLRPPIG